MFHPSIYLSRPMLSNTHLTICLHCSRSYHQLFMNVFLATILNVVHLFLTCSSSLAVIIHDCKHHIFNALLTHIYMLILAPKLFYIYILQQSVVIRCVKLSWVSSSRIVVWWIVSCCWMISVSQWPTANGAILYWTEREHSEYTVKMEIRSGD